ncbi:MAG TPA: type II toxin-antitoxin system Phd/YefM family antitoxin [Thermomicrobiales bacterium]|nr:type II toxin-antitoxin system Phd/YefM family antitoxin [Thermomicrobiales bacterium]
MNDPLWEEVQGIDGFGREDLVELARAGVTAYIAERPEHAAAIDPLIEESELQTLEWTDCTVTPFVLLSGQSRQEVPMAWQIQEAKQKFSELVDMSIDEGPQTITRRGTEVAVLMSIDEYHRLTDSKPSFAEFLLARNGPYFDDLDLERDQSLFRDVEL